MNKKFLVSLALIFLVTPQVGAVYDEVDCSSDVIFEANSCSQCFNGGAKAQGDFIGLLKDDWINATDVKRLLYKEEQKMPSLVSLDEENVAWSQTPSSDGFWEYTPELELLYSEDEEGYVLEAGKKVTWIQSKQGYAYKLDKNTAPENTGIGLLVYPISTHTILDDSSPSIDDEEHRECVIFKSAVASVAPEIVTAEPTKLPDTGPREYILLFILALMLGFAFMTLRSRA